MELALKFPISLFLSRTNTYKFQVGSNFPPFSSLWAHSALGSPHTQHGRVKLISQETQILGPVVGTPHFHCRGHGFYPWSGTKTPHATELSQKKNPKNQNQNKTKQKTSQVLIGVFIQI